MPLLYELLGPLEKTELEVPAAPPNQNSAPEAGLSATTAHANVYGERPLDPEHIIVSVSVAPFDPAAYAGTFQSVGQYRTALLKHIDNLGAAERSVAAVDQAKKISRPEIN